ncbi:MAG: SpoIIE family protein phosphatase [Brevinematales bacterium]|nr:SpoIIE family protein phosphatase [Brevinematales bacterium]
MLMFANLNIRAKLSIIISVIVVSISLIMSVIFIVKSNNEMMTSIITRSGMLAKSMAVLSANYIAGFQYLDIQRAIEDVVSSDREIVYGYLEDVSGEVISPVFKDEVVKDQNKIVTSYKQISKVLRKLDSIGYGFSSDVSVSLVLHGNEQCVDVKVPVLIGDAPASYIRIGTTMKYLNRELLGNIVISTIIVIFLIGLGILFSWYFAKSFSTPILRLKDAAVAFGNKNFDYKVEVLTNDEIGVLAKTFDEMRKNIKEYSEHLEELVAQRTKELQEAYEKLKEKDRIIQMELDFASKIQKGIMPNGGYKWHDFVIFGYSQPMEKIGGDFFDIFPVPGGKLLFYVADVSGHGIPAALITTMLKISLLNISFEKQDPSEIIERLNERIRIINSDMKDQVIANYLTIFTSIVDKEGNMSFASGGHHKPVIYNAFSKQFKEIPDVQGAIVGILEPDMYVCASSYFKIDDGDIMFLYTDGVTERRNLSNKELELDGFKSIVADAVDRNYSGKKLLSYVLNRIEEFAEGVPPRDDFTLLLVQKIKE